MDDVDLEFLLISEAVERLEAGMFGGAITRSEPVKELKQRATRLSVGFGPQRDAAASGILRAMLEDDLPVYVIARSIPDENCRWLVVPVEVLQLMPRVRGGLPDHPVRQPISLLRNKFIVPELFAALASSALHLKRSEFEAWYGKQKSLRRWLSQRTSKKPRVGRPSKQTEQVLNLIRALVAEDKWAAPLGIAKLTKLLASKGEFLRNTLRRAVDQLYLETGDPKYRIIARKRAKSTSAGEPT
ncbi:hypothetical protein [Tardiphaga robiniae]|uniref:Uncharacterized protein n=1 Tax=Tardiphaga robiniae TaxID=943830 RepID=A0A163ZV37_9BRAD|nr:hypothetical protein [Tardiphaga robiniae]KZD23897.1 hypothetical protein A4A58_25195 [Tardiphaga robiniae]